MLYCTSLVLLSLSSCTHQFHFFSFCSAKYNKRSSSSCCREVAILFLSVPVCNTSVYTDPQLYRQKHLEIHGFLWRQVYLSVTDKLAIFSRIYLIEWYLLFGDLMQVKTNSKRHCWAEFANTTVFALGLVKVPWIGMCSLCVLYFFLCSNGHDSPGNPSQSSISQPVSRFSPVFPGPRWYAIHNATPGSPLRACNPSILSNQSALFQQEHISTMTEGGFTTSGALGEKGAGESELGWKESVRTILMLVWRF